MKRGVKAEFLEKERPVFIRALVELWRLVYLSWIAAENTSSPR